jgi:hypothetical protein
MQEDPETLASCVLPDPQAEAGAALSPWPLDTRAAFRFVAWPDYASDVDLGCLLDVYVTMLEGRPDTSLVLRHDPEIDGEIGVAMERVQAALDARFPEGFELDIPFVVDPMGAAEWIRLARAVHGALILPGSGSDHRLPFYRVMAAETGLIDNPRTIHGLLGEAPAEVSLADEVAALQPWAEPVIVGTETVIPGKGTERDTKELSRAVVVRQPAIVDGAIALMATQGLDLGGTHVLELGSGCGHWASWYVGHGATHVTLVEGRLRCAKQAMLYWSANSFVVDDAAILVQGNLDHKACWARIDVADITLCTGILHLTADPAQVLARAVAHTRHAIVVDIPDDQAAHVAEAEDPDFGGIGPAGHVLDADEVRAALMAAGLQVHEVEREEGQWATVLVGIRNPQ